MMDDLQRASEVMSSWCMLEVEWLCVRAMLMLWM
jgi:hypothetical protein